MPRISKRIVTASFVAALSAALGALGQDVLSQDRRAFADGLLSRGLYKLALPEYEALSKQNPPPQDLDVVLARLAECRRKVGDNAGAVKAAERVVKEFPTGKSRFQALLTQAQAISALGDARKASEIFDEIATTPSADKELRLLAMYYAGMAMFNAGEYAGARSRFTTLANMAKEVQTPQAKDLRGFAELFLTDILSRGDAPEAKANAIKAYALIAQSPISPRVGAEALYKGAVLAYQTKNYAEAVARFADLASKYPDDPRVADSRILAMWANFSAGRYSEAAQIAERTMEQGGVSNAELAECSYIKASSLANLMRRKEAVEAYDALIAKYPGTKFAASATYERLLTLFKDGDFERVLADAPKVSNPSPAIAPDLVWLQAESAEALKNPGQASQFYRMLVDKYPDSRLAPDAAYRYANHLRETQAWGEAAKAYQKLVAAHPESPLVPYCLYASGCCLFNCGKFEDAVRDFDALLGKYPNDSLVGETLLQKAVALYRTKNLREAGATLDLLISKYPNHARLRDARFERARICYELEDFQAAEKFLQQVLAGNPPVETAREANFLLGLVYDAMGRPADAAAKFQPLLADSYREKLPSDRLVWLADFQFARKKFAEALEATVELEARELPADLRQKSDFIAARSHMALSNTNAAVAAFRRAAESGVKTRLSAEAALRLGEILMDDTNQLQMASRYLTSAVSLASSPDMASTRALAYYQLARAAERRGDVNEAIRLHLAMSILYEGDPSVAKAFSEAVRLLKVAGREEEIADVMAEFRARYPKEAAAFEAAERGASQK